MKALIVRWLASLSGARKHRCIEWGQGQDEYRRVSAAWLQAETEIHMRSCDKRGERSRAWLE